MGFTSKTKGRLAAVVIFAAFMILYFLTLYKGIAPGKSAHNVAVGLGLEQGISQTQIQKVETTVTESAIQIRMPTQRQTQFLRTITAEFETKHLIWNSTAKFITGLPFGNLDLRLNGFSALLGAIAITLAFALCRGLILFLYFHDSMVSAENRKAVAMATGLITAVTLGLSTPFWLSATRFLPNTFDVLLIMAMGWFLFSSSVTQKTGLFLIFGFLWSISLFELELGPYIAIMMLFFMVRAMLVGGILNIKSWCYSLVGMVSGFVVYLMMAKYTTSASSMLLPVNELAIQLKLLKSLILDGALFEDHARLISLFLAIIPFIAVVALSIWQHVERNITTCGFLIFILTCLSVLAIVPTSISPYGAYKATYPDHLPVILFILISAVASYLASIGAILAKGRLFGKGRNTSDEDDDEDGNEAPVGRLLFWVILSVTLISGIVNFKEINNNNDTFIEKTSVEMAHNFDKFSWMTSTTRDLDTMIKISAHKHGSKIRVINHNRGKNDYRQLQKAVRFDDAFKGLDTEKLLSSLISTNNSAFISEWIKTDPMVGKKLILDSPAPWLASGRIPIPAIVGYRALERNETINWKTLADEHIAFWKIIKEYDSCQSSSSSFLKAKRNEIKTYLCDIGQNLAEELVKINDASKAREVLDIVEELRRAPHAFEHEKYLY